MGRSCAGGPEARGEGRGSRDPWHHRRHEGQQRGGSWENLIEALRGRDIADEDIPSPFDIFQTMRIEPDGRLLDTTIRPRDGAHLDLRAEINCLVAISACPESGRGQPVTIQIFAS